MRFNSVGVVFTWVLLTLSCYRLQRIVTTDSWPLSEAFRQHLERWADKHARSRNNTVFQTWRHDVSEFFSCPHCFGTIATWVIFTIAAQFVSIPLPVLQAIAASAIVGIIGEREN